MAEYSFLKKFYFNIVFLAGILLLLLTVEAVLRLFDYGYDTEPFVKLPDMQEVYVDNPDFLIKYYGSKIPYKAGQIKNIFKAEKEAGMLRGIVIGGSTAEGYPYKSNQSFSKITEAALKSTGKYKDVQIVNLGYAAMSSYYVRDAAIKALDYSPDFIALYSGHNEYYGTISQTTSGWHNLRLLSLKVKELKIFQFLYGLFEQDRKAGSGDMNEHTTFMEERFSNVRIESDLTTDKEAASDFIANIDAVVRAAEDKKIPVIVFEPVSNYLDMPPFAGKDDKQFSVFIKEYISAIKSNSKKKIKEFLAKGEGEEYGKNANIVYLNAIAVKILEGTSQINKLIEAKDLDIAPFRARSVFAKSLLKYGKSKTKPDNFYLINTSNIFEKILGVNAFGNKIFIDHLHFNHEGQRVLAGILAEKIFDVFQVEDVYRKKITSYFKNIAEVRKGIHFTDLDELVPYLQVNRLLKRPPFSQMMNPYQLFDYQKKLIGNDILKTRELSKLIPKSGDFKIPFGSVVLHYINKKDKPKVAEYFRSYYQQYVGDVDQLRKLAYYSSQTPFSGMNVVELYIHAYLLSGKREDLYLEMSQYLKYHKMYRVLNQINTRYGKPGE